jgi:hypothetical protein
VTHVVEQLAMGVTAIYPASAVMGILLGTEGTKLQVATGEYNKKIEQKIDEIRGTCGSNAFGLIPAPVLALALAGRRFPPSPAAAELKWDQARVTGSSSVAARRLRPDRQSSPGKRRLGKLRACRNAGRIPRCASRASPSPI